jgi:hypothetical protein
MIRKTHDSLKRLNSGSFSGSSSDCRSFLSVKFVQVNQKSQSVKGRHEIFVEKKESHGAVVLFCYHYQYNIVRANFTC